MRTAEIKRTTAETDITVKLDLDGAGKAEIKSGNGFFNHMLELFTAHSRIDLNLRCDGDTWVDFHHSAEDIGIVLGEAFRKALGDKGGINRYGDIVLPMDEALVVAACDFSGRAFLNYKVRLRATRISDDAEESPATVGVFDTELVEEFFLAFTRTAGVTLHIVQLEGKNTHHILEAVFKGFGRAVKAAVSTDASLKGEIPSTKGVLL